MRSSAIAIVVSAVLISGCAAPVATKGTTLSGPKSVEFSITDPFIAKGLIEVSDIGGDELTPVLKKFDERVTAGDLEIMFRLDSYGGSIFAGLDFIQHVEDATRNKGILVTCVVDTKAYSMAFVILQSGACTSRLMTERSTLLAHNGRTTVKGTAVDIESEAKFLRALDESMASLVVKRMGTLSLSDYRYKVEGKDWTMASTEALEVNAVDDVVDPELLPDAFALDPVDDGFLKLLGL